MPVAIRHEVILPPLWHISHHVSGDTSDLFTEGGASISHNLNRFNLRQEILNNPARTQMHDISSSSLFALA